ncbi:sodium- and chloride-dependent betaine transporter-like [Clavelina lepadiformis]|uniref:sodium- and chloride-dependent betaine transporter-like n=1 Tax=Clavelina lepadiformis TaxID=159417 RepID=UPI004041D24A
MREKWTNRFDFLFVTVGSAVGLGNMWRFPYLCYRNGGGAFLIPYLVTLLVVALPQLILQVSLGQYTSLSPVKAWEMVPAMKGIGYATIVYAVISNVSYSTVLAWTLRYLYASMSPVLPWMTCTNSWNTLGCFVPDNNQSTSKSLYVNASGTNSTRNTSEIASSVAEFWTRGVLGLSEGLTDIGRFQTPLVVCLTITWILIFLAMLKGANWTSKVTYVTSTLPIFILVAVLVRGVTLDGSYEGIIHFVKPNMTKLSQPQVWKDALLQNLFSLSLGSGGMMTMGSFNSYHHNFLRDAIALSVVNSCASFLAGFAVFSTLGFMAKQQNTTVDLVAESGPGLVFTVYPQALSMMPGSQFWSVAFFLMLFLLGLDSLFVIIEAVSTVILDQFPAVFDKQLKKIFMRFCLCCFYFFAALITVTQGGMYYIHLIDNFSSTSWALLFSGGCECIAISWIFGLDRFYEIMCDMLQFRPRFPWFKYCWKYVVPLLSAGLFIYCLVLYKPLVYNRTYEYPAWSIGVGWLLSLSSFLWIPGYAAYYLIKKRCLEQDKRKMSDAGKDQMEMEELKVSIAESSEL